MKYLLMDLSNTFFRARHTAHRAQDTWEKIGYSLHIAISSINRVARKFNSDHVVFALEGRSWRKDFYPPYKRNRSEARSAMTQEQQDEDRMFWETYDHLCEYLRDSTNCSVIRHAEAEADDIIARWIALHPTDQHVIVSSDTDFVQLISPTVSQYNGITGELITHQGHFDDKDRPVIDRHTKQPKAAPDAQWLLFEKCMRGDPTDNVFSAFPGVRTHGTKNRTGLTEAYQDRDRQGFAWNNLMLQRWTDHEGQEHRVLDDYERNRILIDLTAQPDAIKHAIDAEILQQTSARDVGQVGAKFMKFCARFELTRLSDNAAACAQWLNQTYQGGLHDQS